MLWLALHCPPPASAGNDVASPPSAARSDDFWPTLACWAGRYTPRVNLGADALRLEIGASLRLFGGLPALLGMLWQLQSERRMKEERQQQEIKRQFIELHREAQDRNSKKHIGPAMRALMGEKQPQSESDP